MLLESKITFLNCSHLQTEKKLGVSSVNEKG